MRASLLFIALIAGCDHAAPSVGAAFGEHLAPPSLPGLDLDVTAILPGQPATFTVVGAIPGERVTLLRSFGQPSAGPCPPVIGGLCLDIAGPVGILGSAITDASGFARLTVVVPTTAPIGLTVSFQAVVARGAGGSASDKSQALARAVGAALPTPVADLVVGDLVVTEVLQDPTVVADAVGEWFEVYNASDLTVDLAGLVVSDLDGDSFTIGSPLVVGAGGFAVLGAELDPTLNGGVPVDYAWSGFTLGNADDEIVLSVGALELDVVAWDDGATFPDPAGDSMALDPAAWGVVENDDGGFWCVSLTTGGTPGTVNDPCPAPACGDGALDPGEMCDDGGVLPGDGCDALCQLEGCGVPAVRTGRWQTTVASGFVTSAARTSDGSVVFGGPVSSASAANARVSAAGVAAAAASWTKDLTYSVLGFPLRGLAAAPDGGTYAMGLYKGTSENQSGIVRLAADGSVVWRRYFGTMHSLYYDLLEEPRRAVATSDGGLLILGEIIDVHPAVAETYAQVKKVSSTGTLQWQQVWEHLGGGVGGPTARAAAELPDGSVMVGGDKPDLLLFDDAGNVLWGLDSATPWDIDDMVTVAGGDVLVAGRVGSQRSPMLTRLREDGTVVWARVISHSSPGPVQATRAAATPEVCQIAPVPGAVCPEVGDTCATVSDVCACDGVWSCEPGEQRYVLAWTNGAGSGSVPSGTSQVWSAFDSGGALLRTRGVAGIGTVTAMSADDGGVVSVAVSGATVTVLRTTATLDGACSATDYTGLTIASSLSLSTPVGPWYIPVAPEAGTASVGDVAAALPSFSTACSADLCP